MSWRIIRQGLPKMAGCRPSLIFTLGLFLTLGFEVRAPANDEDESRRQQELWNFIPRDRRLRETLAAVQHIRPQSRSSEAIKLTQWILDQPFDAFVVSPNKELLSIHRTAEARLRAFPVEWRQEYERTFGLEARQLFEDAVQRDDERLAIEVLRRFRLTAAGDDAAIWLAGRWRDRGELKLALAALVPSYSAQGSLQSISTERLFTARALATAIGDERLADAIHKELITRPDAPTSNTFLPPLLADEPSPVDCLSATADLGCTYGDRDNLPVLRPRWTAPLMSAANQKSLTPLLDTWRSQLQGMNLSPVSPNRPLAVRNQLVLRTDDGIKGFDLVTGRNLWSFPCATSLITMLREVARNRPAGGDLVSLVSHDALQSWFGGNSQLGLLSSDGVRIYFIDSVALANARQLNRLDAFQQAKSTDAPPREEFNRLVAMELPMATSQKGQAAIPPKVVWEFGSPRTTNGKGRFFFGPPIAHAGRLLGIIECDREVRLLALQAETGKVIWEQPLAAVDKSVLQDGDRAFTACTPVLAGDVVLCPTGTGVLAAVDAVTGALRWSYFDGDLPADPSGRPRGTTVSRGRGGFAPVTVVRHDQVLHLPVNSSYLHVLNRGTGRLVRTIPRQRACSLLAATENLAVLLEARACRAVDYHTGMDIWRREVPPVAGTGLVLGQELLIPIDQGRFTLLDVATGHELTWQPTRSDVSLGNLIICGDDVLSQTPEGIAVFPQAGFVERLLSDSSTPPETNERRLLAAELELSMGRLEEAEKSLEAALEDSLTSEQAAQPRHLLRELLYSRLETNSDHSGEIITRLKRLAVSAEEQGRLLAYQARRALDERDARELRQALEELAQLPTDITSEAAGESGWRQSSSACCRQLLTEAEREIPEFAVNFRRQLLQQLSRGVARDTNPDFVEFVLHVCREEPAAAKLRDQLARQTRGKHGAELLWLQNLRSGDAEWAAAAAKGLAELWSESGWSRDSVMPLRALLTTWERTSLGSGRTGREIVEQWPDRSEAKQWLRRAMAPSGKIESISIRSAQELELPELAPLESAKNRPAEFRRPRDPDVRQRFEPIEALSAEISWQTQGEYTLLSVVEKPTSQRIHQWQLPSPISPPFQRSSACQAHYFPVGLVGEFRGYSLLDLASDAPAWTQRPAALQRRKSVAIVGPGGPGFVTFQVENSIYVCDPVDGHVLWQRSELEPYCGLLSDPVCGIAGDEQCLVIFGANRTSYVVYDTMTGKQLRTAQLEPEQSPPRRTPFGRRVLRIMRERSQFSARIWDPLHDKYDVQEALGDRNTLFQTISATEVAWITPKGAVTVYDVPNARRTVEAQLPEEDLEKMNSLRFIKDGQRLYVNLQRNTPTAQTRDYNNSYDKSTFPMTSVRDDFFAFDAKTGRLLWRKTIPQRSIVRLDPPGLPFLVMLSLVRDRHDGALESLLVEILDADTGEVLGRQDHLAVDRLLHAAYDGLEQTVTLQGLKSRIQIAWKEQPTSTD